MNIMTKYIYYNKWHYTTRRSLNAVRILELLLTVAVVFCIIQNGKTIIWLVCIFSSPPSTPFQQQNGGRDVISALGCLNSKYSPERKTTNKTIIVQAGRDGNSTRHYWCYGRRVKIRVELNMYHGDGIWVIVLILFVYMRMMR